MNKIFNILIICLFVMNCSGKKGSIAIEAEANQPQKDVVDDVIPILSSEKSDRKSQIKNEVYGQLLFKINNGDFFKSDSILGLFKHSEQHKLGFVVPLDFALGAKSIYIPNRLEKTMHNYSKQGHLLGTLKLPQSYSPDYFTLLSNNSLVVNDFHLDTVFQINHGQIEFSAENSDLRFSAFGENILFRNRTRFFDKKGYFNGEYKFTYLYSTFDYSLINEASFCLVYYDHESERGKLEIIREKGIIETNKYLNLALDWEDFYGVKILKANENNCFFLLMGGIGDLNTTKLVQYNLNSEEVRVVSLKNEYEGNVFIGEGVDLWSCGAMYKYNDSENAIYSLFTGDEFIYLYKYPLE